MKFFAEKRLVFDETPDGKPPAVETAKAEDPSKPGAGDETLVAVPVPTPSPIVPAVEAAGAKKEGGKVEEKVEAGKGLEKVKTGLSLAALKLSHSADLQSLTMAAGIRGEKFDGPLVIDKTKGEIDLSRVKDDLYGRIKALIEKGDTSRLTEIFKKLESGAGEVNEGTVVDATADLYATGFVARVKKDFEAKYPRYAEFAKDKLGYQANFEIEVDSSGNLKVAFKFNPDSFAKDYDAFVAKNPKNPKEKEGEVAVTAADKTNGEAIKTNPKSKMLLAVFAPLLGFFDGLPVGKDGKIPDEAYADIAAGKYPWAGAILQFCGAKDLVRGDCLKDCMAGLSPKTQTFLEGIKGKVNKSPLNLGSLNDKMTAIAGTVGTLFGIDKLKGLFGGSETMPGVGAKVKKDFLSGAFGGEGLMAKLGKGAELIVPKGATLKLSDAEDIVAKDGPISLAGKAFKILPPIKKDTLFKGDIDFSWIDKLV
jgi:hypothetical protein